MALPLSQAAAADTFHNLVRQFSQELSFYRELIQNALDAATNRVDLWLEYDAERGLAVAHVQDEGEGMDRHVIDTQLTRMFSSEKQDDLTKIGKFGIGFVSVFAVSPELVVVETGKNGESWRLIFKPNGEFDRVRLEAPLAGTHIQVYKRMPVEEYPTFVTQSSETVRYWCRYSPVDIFFNGDRINEPFDVPGDIKVRCDESGTEVVVSLQRERKTTFGFYNGGITLLEDDMEPAGASTRLALLDPYRDVLAGTHFRIRSRYLEHTLTRDTVRQDEHFSKALKILVRAIEGPLMAAMYQSLAAARGQAWSDLVVLCAPQVRRTLSKVGQEVHFIPCLGRSAPASFGDLQHAYALTGAFLANLGAYANKVVFFDDHATPVLTELETDIPVVAVGANHVLLDILQAQGAVLMQVSQRLVPLQMASEHFPNVEALRDNTVKLLDRCELHFSSARLVHLGGQGRPCLLHKNEQKGVAVAGLGPLRHNEAPPPWYLLSLSRGHLLFDVDHPLLASLAALHQRDPVAAAFMLGRQVCLAEGLHPTMQERLLSHALEEDLV